MERSLINKGVYSIFLLLAETGKLWLFFFRTVKTVFTTLPVKNEVLKQAVEIGIESLPVLAAVSVFIGMNVAIEGYSTFLRFGGENMIGVFAGMTEIRELCPAIAAAIVTAKAGTRIAASIGLMRIKEQIDALEVMAVDPFRFIIAPRFIATIIMFPFLVLISDAIAIGSTYLVARIQLGLDPGSFWNYTVSYIHMSDIYNGMIKGLVFGVIISVMCCYFGFVAEKGPVGVGRATNKAVVFTGMVLILINLVLTDMMYN